MAELKPCPFCGGKDVGLMNRFPRFHDERTTTYTVCYTCGGRSVCSESARDAIEAWNRRSDGK